MIFPCVISRPSPTLRQFYSFLPVCFLRLKIQPPYFMRTLTVVVFIWNNIGCWDEKAMFTFPNMPPVPFVTTASSLNCGSAVQSE